MPFDWQHNLHDKMIIGNSNVSFAPLHWVQYECGEVCRGAHGTPSGAAEWDWTEQPRGRQKNPQKQQQLASQTRAKVLKSYLQKVIDGFNLLSVIVRQSVLAQMVVATEFHFLHNGIAQKVNSFLKMSCSIYMSCPSNCMDICATVILTIH